MIESFEQHALDEFLTNRGYVAVPLTCNAAGHFEIAEARLDGRAVRLLLDTGASHTVIDHGSAERLGFATADSQRRGGGVGGTDQPLSSITTSALSLGPAVCESMSFYTMDLTHVSTALSAHGGQPIDGAIGGDILRPRGAIIDYAGAMLYLRASGAS